MFILWAPTIFLGVWESNENIGIYSAANRTAMLTSFVLVAVNSIAAPKFAALYQEGDIDALGSLARNSTKIMVLLASPALLLFFMLPEWVLAIFGQEFKQGSTVLIILALGQFINVVTGSVGYLLMMSGYERLMRNVLFVCMFISIILNILLIPNYGIIGGALAAALVISIQNLIAMTLVYKKLKILTLPWISHLLIKHT
jgi:O-antigen/teichoic acid export membrane protein